MTDFFCGEEIFTAPSRDIGVVLPHRGWHAIADVSKPRPHPRVDGGNYQIQKNFGVLSFLAQHPFPIDAACAEEWGYREGERNLFSRAIS